MKLSASVVDSLVQATPEDIIEFGCGDELQQELANKLKFFSTSNIGVIDVFKFGINKAKKKKAVRRLIKKQRIYGIANEEDYAKAHEEQAQAEAELRKKQRKEAKAAIRYKEAVNHINQLIQAAQQEKAAKKAKKTIKKASKLTSKAKATAEKVAASKSKNSNNRKAAGFGKNITAKAATKALKNYQSGWKPAKKENHQPVVTTLADVEAAERRCS